MSRLLTPEIVLAILASVALTLLAKPVINYFRARRKSNLPGNSEPRLKTRVVQPKKPKNISGGSTGPRNPAAFFPDKPAPDDYLDFMSYAKTLSGLIAHEDTQTPLTVGLFGAWGSGKTTLMRMIERALEEEPGSKRFVFVRFDAWKYYKEDALWRAMLLRVLDVLRPDENDQSKADLRTRIERLEDALYRDVEWKEKGGVTIDWPKLIKGGAGGALKLTFSFVPGLSTLSEAVTEARKAIGGGKPGEDISLIAEAFQRNLVTHHQSQLLHLEQFQERFHELVKEYFADQLLVIFVDDLDRCLPEKAIEVLEAIKLFLDVEGCIFILGIDQEVITRGLEAKYKESGLATNGQSPAFSTHYIEKLIQLPFYLPPIEAHEMQSYITSLNVAWPHPDCAQVFAEGLSPNPRQIKRTINVFMLLWRLSEKRSNLGEAVTPLRLAKVVILQTAHPRVFEHLKLDPLLLKQLEVLCCDADAGTTYSQTYPFLVDAIKQSNLKKLFQLLVADNSASFVNLQADELSAFFSLARRAPLVADNLARHPASQTQPAAEAIDQESRPSVQRERPSQLRPPVRDFVGRNEPLERMLTAFRSGVPIGVVTGMAGTGKTEFALLLGERLRPDFPDGQLFIDLQGNTQTPSDPGDALAACIRALAGSERDLPADLEALGALYRSQLSDKRVLVFLDNAASESQITPLIPPKGSVLLVTSRNSLILPAMVGLSLGALSREEALSLFLHISPRVSRDTAAEICALCGYLPPAVRAAASTLAATTDLDPAEYKQQLSDEQKRLELLGTQGVHVSLEASFSLSYSRLPDETKKVFRKLAIFPDTFDARAEEAVCDDSNHSHLSELVRLSLVSYDEAERRYQVHSLMRLFAQQHLEETESESAGKNHAIYYLDVLKDADSRYNEGGKASFKALSIFDRERANISAGFAWSASRTLSDREAASICAQYAKYGLQILEIRKPPLARIEWFEQSLKAAQQFEDSRDRISPLLGLGAAYSKLGQAQEAIDMYIQALGIAHEHKLLQVEALIESNLGLKYRDLRKFDQAVECFQKQLGISRELRNDRSESVALLNLGNVSLVVNRTAEAIEYYEAARKISQKIGDLQTEGLVLGNLGRAYLRKRETKRALELCREQLDISQRFGDRLSEAGARFNIAIALQQQGDLDEAHKEANIALEIYLEIESPQAARVQHWLASIEDPVSNET